MVCQREETQRTEHIRMRVVLLFLLASLQVSFCALVPPEHLYEDFSEIKTLKCNKEDESAKCARLSVIRNDFECRYNGRKRDCYCCGAIYTYIEQVSLSQTLKINHHGNFIQGRYLHPVLL